MKLADLVDLRSCFMCMYVCLSDQFLHGTLPLLTVHFQILSFNLNETMHTYEKYVMQSLLFSLAFFKQKGLLVQNLLSLGKDPPNVNQNSI